MGLDPVSELPAELQVWEAVVSLRPPLALPSLPQVDLHPHLGVIVYEVALLG